MVLSLRLVLLAAVILYSIVLIGMLKKKRLELRFSLLWLFSGICMLFVVLFPDIVLQPMHDIGIAGPINGVLALVAFLLIMLMMSLTGIVSRNHENTRRLVQQLGILEKRTRELETYILQSDKCEKSNSRIP